MCDAYSGTSEHSSLAGRDGEQFHTFLGLLDPEDPSKRLEPLALRNVTFQKT
jgi:hypothetical protein